MPRHLAIDAIVDLPPELTGGVTFHLPLEVFALQHVGASEDHIERRIVAELAEAYRHGLIDPPMYRWAVEQYEAVGQQLLSPSADERAEAWRSIRPLGDGLAGAAFHGLIRLGYGALRRDPMEIARGLAYLRVRRLVLEGPGSADGGLSTLPSSADMAGTTIYDRLTVVAGSGHVGAISVPNAASLAARATDLVRDDASSFVAIHCVTGLHALAEVHLLVTDAAPADDLADSALGTWWRGYGIALDACAQLVGSLPEVGRADCAPTLANCDELMAAAVASADTHSVKLAVSLQRLVEMELVDEATMIALMESKLGADECRA